MTTVQHYIHGELREELRKEAPMPLYNPATGQEIGSVPIASDETRRDVLASATAGAAVWAASSLSQRSAVLFKFRELLAQSTDELAALITREQGKTLADARGELARGLENVEFACGLIEHLKGDFSSGVADGVDVHSFREPVGIVLAVTPFNFPAMVPLWMLANAVAAGNAVIVKPSERDPSAAVRLAELWSAAGLPPGVVNVVHGDRHTVQAFVEDPSVAAISFVGSTPVAKSLYESGTRLGKRVQALGGAKNHMVVLGDADLDVAADAAVNAGFGAAGERCMAISVVVAVGAIADELVDKISRRIDALRVGPGDQATSDLGPLITREHRDRVASYVDGAPHEGATVVRDGAAEIEKPGFFFGPSLLDHVTPEMRCYRDEIFGPVLSVVRVATYAEAIEVVNNNPYGNGVAVFTRDGNVARQFSRDVTVGMIGINVPIPVPVASYSFGGWKDSLFGHAHMYGPEGFAFFTRGKVVTTRWPQPSDSQIDLGFPRTR